jgi:hypothetical protein
VKAVDDPASRAWWHARGVKMVYDSFVTARSGQAISNR